MKIKLYLTKPRRSNKRKGTFNTLVKELQIFLFCFVFTDESKIILM